MPVPDKLTVCWLFATALLLSVTVKVPGKVPASDGRKLTVITQFPPASSDEGHVLV